jgi:hypothetical protein
MDASWMIQRVRRDYHAIPSGNGGFRVDAVEANLRILDVEEIRTVPYAPVSHPSSNGPSGVIGD